LWTFNFNWRDTVYFSPSDLNDKSFHLSEANRFFSNINQQDFRAKINSPKKRIMINGRFYYIQTDSGNLIGEYSNQTSHSNTPESAEMIDRNGTFIGRYNSTWFERIDGESVSMILTINLKLGIRGRILELTWRVNNEIHFYGEGFIFNNMLIGNYWDEELNRLIPRTT
jgi:hypothetical protein